MPKRKKNQHRKRAQPALKVTGDPAGAVPAPERVPLGDSKSLVAASAIEDSGPDQRHSNLKTVREGIAVVTAVAALIVSIGSCHTSRESIQLAQQQAEANRRYHQEHIKPDVSAMVRHSSSSATQINPMAAELVVLNNGPIKAVSLTGAYRVYMVNPTNSYVFASMGVSEPLVDYSFALPELKPASDYVKPILSASSPAIYVVNLTFYRETDMERYSTEDYFLFENGTFYDRASFRSRTNYNTLMESLATKMRCEALGGSNRYRTVDPPLPGSANVNFDLLQIPQDNSPEWSTIISNRTSEIVSSPMKPDGYVSRGTSYLLMHKRQEAASDYERAIQLGSSDFTCYNNLAVIRSTSTNTVLCNGKEAVKLATRACELTGWKNWGCTAGLASAFAEAGDFDSAIKYEREAISMPGMLPLEREEEDRALTRMLKHLPVREGL